MSDKSLRFREIDIRRMPGIERGFAVRGLQPGINLIFGPNGSGKTTIANAMKGLLWPQLAFESSEVTAQCILEDNRWIISSVSGRRQSEREGNPQELPPLPSAQAADRYDLSLHHLLATEGKAFAQLIARETAGGYDLSAAANTLGARSDAASPNIKEVREYRKARKTLREVRQKQQELHREQTRLKQLEQQKEEAAAAATKVISLEQVIAYKEAELTLRTAQVRLDEFPSDMDRIREDDADRLLQLQKRRRKHEEERREYERACARARESMSGTQLPDGGVPAEDMETLAHIRDEIPNMVQANKRLKQDLAGAKQAMAAAREPLGDAVTDKRLAQLGAAKLNTVAKFARQAERVRVRTHILRERLRLLAADDGDRPDIDHLREGRTLLSRWLRHGTASPTPAWPIWLLLVAAVLLMVEPVVLTLSVHPLFAVLIIVGFVSLLAAGLLLYRRVTAPSSSRETIEAHFSELGIVEIKRWTAETVTAALQEMEGQIASAQMTAERVAEMKRLRQQEEESLRVMSQKLKKLRQDLLEHLGVAPEDGESFDEAVLYVLAENVNRWQERAQDARRILGELGEAQEQIQTLLGEANRILNRYGYETTQEVASVQGNINALQTRQQQYRDAQTELSHSQANLDAAERALTEVQREYVAFFDSRGLAPDDENEFYQRLDRLEEYKRAAQELEKAKVLFAEREAACEACPEMGDKSLDALRREQDRAEEQAAERDALTEEIARLHERIEAAKHGHELGDALAEEERRAQALRRKREEDYEAVATHVLAGALKEKATEQARPPVFHRARQLFATITKGQYELTLTTADPPEFRAIDTTAGRQSRSLNELSSGNRLQLLFAVRTAFVQEMEQGPQLPLFLDETLANSDDARARAIIETSLAISEQGRQILYFTAQEDEVNKWKSLAGDDINIIDLAEVRQLAAQEQLPRPEKSFTVEPVPAPNGMSYEEYGDALGVPAIDPYAESGGGVHLWYVLDDVQLLYRLMRNNIKTVGQLKALQDIGDLALLDIAPSDCEQALAYGRVIDEILHWWKVGRGRRVDREALVDSGAVTQNFMDDVSQLADEHDGDGKAIIAALEGGAVARFWSSKCEELQTFFVGEGYIDNRERLSQLEIQLRVKKALASEIEAGTVSTDRIDELVESVLSYQGTGG